MPRETNLISPSSWRGRAMRRTMHLYWRFARPMTIGVRAALIDGERGVFLVRHGYTPGWHMPGGGVEAGETLEQSMAREVREEGHIEITGAPALHGVFFNQGASVRDHVAVYVVREFHQTSPRPPDHEIAESSFFPLDSLPDGVTRGTRERLDEILSGRPISPFW